MGDCFSKCAERNDAVVAALRSGSTTIDRGMRTTVAISRSSRPRGLPPRAQAQHTSHRFSASTRSTSRLGDTYRGRGHIRSGHRPITRAGCRYFPSKLGHYRGRDEVEFLVVFLHHTAGNESLPWVL